MVIISQRKRYEMTHCGYWVGKEITMPPMPFEEWDMLDLTPTLKALVGKKVKILGINNPDDDPLNEIYILIEACEVPFNFGEWFPIEMAEILGYAGLDHFGNEIKITEHPHYDKESL